MIDLNKIVNETLVNLEKEKFVETIVEKRIKQTIESVIGDIFDSWSSFGKSLKKHIEENMNMNFDSLGLEGYNQLILAVIKERLESTIKVKGLEKIKESIDEMLSDVKSEYTLTEIIEKAKEDTAKEDYERDYDEKVNLIIEKSCYGYIHIYLDNKDEKPYGKWDYSCSLALDKEGKAYSIKLNGKEIDSKKIMGGLYGLDNLLFKIYASGAKIILDQGEEAEDYEEILYYRLED